MEITLYHQDTCPQCRMVETLMKKKNINYTSCKDVDYMISIGINHTPTLEVDGTRLVGKELIGWIKEYNQ